MKAIGIIKKHINSHFFLRNLPRTIPPTSLLVIFLLPWLFINFFVEPITLYSVLKVLMIIAVIILSGFRSLKYFSWDVQAKFVFWSFKIAVAVPAIMIATFAIGDITKGELKAIPYLLIAIVALPIWEFMFGLYKHHGKLTLFRISSIGVLGWITYMQLPA